MYRITEGSRDGAATFDSRYRRKRFAFVIEHGDVNFEREILNLYHEHR